MASTQLSTRKDGSRFYRIRVSRGRGKQPFSMNWDVPDGWSKRAIEQKLKKVAAEFERACKAGEVLTREEAKEQEQKKQEEAARIKTVEEFGESVFMAQVEATKSENTRAAYQTVLNLHIYPVIGNIRMNEVESAQLSALLLSLQTEKGMKHKSVKMAYNILSQIFKKAYLSRLILPNPMDFVECPKPTNAEGKETGIEMYTAEELKYILKCLENEPLQWQAYVRILVDTGCRRGEAGALKWSCVDLEKREIRIESSLNYTPNKGIYCGNTKTGGARTIPISKKTADLLKLIREQQKQAQVVSLDGWVFTREDLVTVMHPVTPSQFFEKFGKQYNINHFHPHKLRHTAISQLLINGADVKTVAEIAGHANATMTLSVYAHSDLETQKKALEVYRRNVLDEKQA